MMSKTPELNPIIQDIARTRENPLRFHERLKGLRTKNWEFFFTPQETEFNIWARIQSLQVSQANGFVYVEPTGIVPRGLDSYLTRTNPFKIAHVAGHKIDLLADITTFLSLVTYLQKRASYSRGELGVNAIASVGISTRLQRYTEEGYRRQFLVFGNIISGPSKYNKGPEDFLIKSVIINLELAQRLLPSNTCFRIRISNLSIIYTLVDTLNMTEQLAYLTEEEWRYILQQKLNIKKQLFAPDDFKQQVNTNPKISQILASKKIASRLERRARRLAEITGVDVLIDIGRLWGRGHYHPEGTVWMIDVKRSDGTYVDIGDGGYVDWVSKLLNDQQEISVVGGIGISWIYHLIQSGALEN